MRKIYFIIILVLLALGCKKEEETTTIIKGNVIDLYTQTNINGGDLYLVDISIDPTDPQLRQSDPYDPDNIEEVISIESNGFFNQEIIGLNKNGSFYLVYYDELYISDTYPISNGSINENEISVKPFKVLRINIKNINDYFDNFSITIWTDDKIYQQFFSIGNSIDTNLIMKVIPDADCHMDYTKVKNDSMNVSLDTTIFIENIDTTYYEIYY